MNIGFSIPKDEEGYPLLIENEQIYLAQEGVCFIVWKEELRNVKAIVTTHRLILQVEKHPKYSILGVPLFYFCNTKSAGGFLHSHRIEISLMNTTQHPPYVIEKYQKILKAPLPDLPLYPSAITLKFKTGGKDKFLSKLRESMKFEHWLLPIKEEKQGVALSKQAFGGMAGIRRNKEEEARRIHTEISSGFQDLASLQEKGRKLVTIAEKIRGKLAQTEGGAISKEMEELQNVMFNVGIGSPITREASGKDYYKELAKQLSKFLEEVLGKYGGILTLIDIYCLYNRARGTDLVSPEDVFRACQMFKSMQLGVTVKMLRSNVLCVQSSSFNEGLQIQRIQEILREEGGMTPDQLSETINVNMLIIKEILLDAEKQGELCRDESVEGLKYYENLFLKEEVEEN